jgi:hypothetical protein
MIERTKEIKTKTDYYIEFSDEELSTLGWKKNQQISIEIKDESIIMKPFVKLEIDTTDWPKDLYEFLVKESLEQNKTVNQIIIDSITKVVDGKDNLQLINENGNV